MQGHVAQTRTYIHCKETPNLGQKTTSTPHNIEFKNTFHQASIKLNATAKQLHVRSQSNTQMDTVTMKRMVCAQTNNSEMDTFDIKTEESAPNPYENFMKDFNKMVIQWKQ